MISSDLRIVSAILSPGRLFPISSCNSAGVLTSLVPTFKITSPSLTLAEAAPEPSVIPEI